MPIMIGVTLSSVTDVKFQLYGFLAAVLSTLIGMLTRVVISVVPKTSVDFSLFIQSDLNFISGAADFDRFFNISCLF
jgi:hypothetical protein